MPGRLEGKVAVITGAASGIGREAARRFAQEGARVCAADLADELGEETAAEIDGLYVHADVSDPDDVQSMYREAAERFGGIDVLFNNAGISPSDDASILETEVDAWRRVQDVNLKSVFLCCKYGIPYLLERGGGSVINTASFVAVMGAATSQISYTASKGGVLALSRELLEELFAKDPEEAEKRLVHLPMGRFAEATEIANGALFLASDESSYVTASTFLVDGGLSGAYVTPE
jgi:NAD(P)-dependent dehydrogenase (short-subunit alcohol dehydrogenase family)